MSSFGRFLNSGLRGQVNLALALRFLLNMLNEYLKESYDFFIKRNAEGGGKVMRG